MTHRIEKETGKAEALGSNRILAILELPNGLTGRPLVTPLGGSFEADQSIFQRVERAFRTKTEKSP